MKKLSIIVPVYNVERYIEECLSSLLIQTLDNIEIIIVNDGSTDKSIDLIRKFDDERVIIIDKENEGVSVARNVGLKVSSGEYITFVDSDDFINDRNSYKEMYEIAKRDGTDIVAGNAIYYYSDGSKEIMNRSECFYEKSIMNNEEFLLKSLQTKRVFSPVWLNIYKRSLIFDNSIYFKEGILHEDELFIPKVLLKAKNKVSIYEKNFYMYRQRKGSIMNSNNSVKRTKDKFYVATELNSMVNEIGSDMLKFEFNNYIIRFIIYAIYVGRINNIPDEIKKILYTNNAQGILKFKIKLIKIKPSIYITYENLSDVFKSIRLKVSNLI